MLDLHTFLNDYHARRMADIERTEVHAVPGWNLSHFNRIVFYCPACKQKTGADIDTSDGLPEALGHQCECGVEIELQLEWVVVPDLVDVKIKLLKGADNG